MLFTGLEPRVKSWPETTRDEKMRQKGTATELQSTLEMRDFAIINRW